LEGGKLANVRQAVIGYSRCTTTESTLVFANSNGDFDRCEFF